MNVTIQRLTGHDTDWFAGLLRLFRDVFGIEEATLPSLVDYRLLLAQPGFLVFVAWLNGEVVGGLTAYVLPNYHTEQTSVYLYDLAVATQHQRQGIGKQLLTSLLNYCQEAGFGEVFVQADGEDTEAIQFYQATGGQATPVVHFTYPLRES